MVCETWVVAANSSKARIFRVASREKLEELEGLIHAESRLRDGDLVSDRRGRAYDRMGGGRHALEQEVEPHQREAVHFAAHLAHHLKECWESEKFQKIYVIASPTFLGFLRRELVPQVRERVAGEVSKDVTQLTLAQIREHLPYIP